MINAENKHFIHKFNTKKNSKMSDIETYLFEPLVYFNQNSDIMDYWRSREHDLPILCILAVDYLSFPSSSSAIEKKFSCATSLLSNKYRNNLKGESVEKILLLQNWNKSFS